MTHPAHAGQALNNAYAVGFSAGQVDAAAPTPTINTYRPQFNEQEAARKRFLYTLDIARSPTTYQYPLSLENKEEFVNSVIFYINARSNSRIGESSAMQLANYNPFKEAQAARDEQYNSENRAKSEFAQQTAAAIGGLGGGTIAAGIGQGIGTLVTGNDAAASGAAQNRVLGGLLGGLAGAGLGIALGNAVTENTTTVRLLSAIELYVSAPPSAEYAAEWQNVELGVIGGGLSQGALNDLSLDKILEDTGDLAKFAGRSIIQAAATLPRALGISGDLGGAIEATSKKVANPYKEQLFKNMGFRSFGFSYKFNPRNRTELTSVMEIIQLFKYHMHPEIDPSRLYLIYPSEFNIEYRYKGERNKYIHKISTCALTNVRVTYGSSDFTTFSNTGGAPSEINLDLTFSELETLDNSRIGTEWSDSY